MRPVLLEMDGFASFRQRTTVNFDDVDYVALVGATGAGKSTVIDAITFALYGSVARWDDQGAVAPALAPTVNRGTVRLVFDVRGARYQVLRELRRDGNGKVGTKTARLEQLVDPAALGSVDDAIELVAGSLRETLAAVEQLLGLDFNQFIKCVALPQGDFAEFLHARPSERDKILTKLLGLEGYLTLGKTATARATRLATQATTLQDQLDTDQTDTSDDALTAATTRHQALDTLQGKVQTDLDELARFSEQERAAATVVSGLEQTVERLSGLALPEHVRPLDDDLAAATTAHATATAALTAAEKADELARAAVREHQPRSRLEAWQQQHTRRQQLVDAVPALLARTAQTKTDRTDAETARDTARTALTTVEQAERDARDAAATADTTCTTGKARLDALQGVVRPATVDSLCQALETATGECDLRKQATREAQTLLQRANTRRSALPGDVLLERADHAQTAADGARSTLSVALTAVVTAHTQARSSADAASRAEQGLARAEQAANASRARLVAGQLRADLHDGDTCPVCDQHVAHAPDPLGDSDADSADRKLGAARTAHTTADRTATRTAAALQTATAAVLQRHEELHDATGSVHRMLTTLSTTELAAPDLAELPAKLEAAVQSLATTTGATSADDVSASVQTVTAALRQHGTQTAALHAYLRELQQRVADADLTVEQGTGNAQKAETAHATAVTTLGTLSTRTQKARAELREVRDRLVPLGAPDVDDSDLLAAWATLTSWATERAVSQEQTVAAARQDASAVTATWQQTVAVLQAAQSAALTAETAYEGAVRAAEQAHALEVATQTQLGELETDLAGAPAVAEVDALLVTLSGLEEACATAEQTLTARRLDAADALQQLGALSDAQRAARAELAVTRDPLVTLGAPALTDDEGLVASWTSLLAWAQTTRQVQQTALSAARVEQDTRTSGRSTADSALRAALTAAGLVEDPRPLVSWAAAAVAGARADAAADVRAIKGARQRTVTLQSQIWSYREQAVVAQQLGRLLATHAFPRWLSRSALQVLVVAASATLMELSGGQFELAVADNESAAFTVIDHTDADAERGVKTLSGGETFQASLSLALALSTHLGALASNGAAQLEAIFIDEGFGTLDETTLDTVATTLETLATSAGRMVGVITHVPQLAARVPVQFAVQRDPRGSSIVRVTP